jgi:uncharacterized membrane protein YphA (DoxX/SURF4 family)
VANIRRGRPAPAADSRHAAVALRVMALLLGVFFLSMGAAKFAWFTNSGVLAERLEGWANGAPPSVRWYIEALAVPGIPVFARLVPLAEIGTGLALIVGFWTRLVAALAFLMVLNFHFASGLLHRGWELLLEPAALPVLGALLALAIGGSKLPFSVRGD